MDRLFSLYEIPLPGFNPVCDGEYEKKYVKYSAIKKLKIEETAR